MQRVMMSAYRAIAFRGWIPPIAIGVVLTSFGVVGTACDTTEPVQAIRSADTLWNYALGQPTTQSSTAYGGTASLAVDGNTDGTYYDNSVTHTNNDAQAWWQVDLGAVASISTIDLWGRTDCCANRLSDFYVLASSDPFTSQDLSTTLQQSGVASVHVSGQAQSPLQTITMNTSARYVRIQLNGTNYLNLAEVRVWGAPPPDLSAALDMAGSALDMTGSCTADTDCDSTQYCDVTDGSPGTCRTTTVQANGGRCVSARQCTSGFCVDNHCCNSACAGSCDVCSLTLGASADGVCTKYEGPGQPACAPYMCNGSGSGCPTGCSTDSNCVSGRFCQVSTSTCVAKFVNGASCGSSSQCASGTCTNSVCTCPTGSTYCSGTGTCIGSGYCCSDSDCTSPPDACRTAQGASCSGGSCYYPTVACATGQSCTNGSCSASPITLTIAPTTSQVVLSSTIFLNGQVSFIATLTNTGQATVYISKLAAGNVTPKRFAYNGTDIAPQIGDSGGQWSYLQDQLGSLQALAGQSSVSFLVPSATFKTPFGSTLYVPASGQYTVALRYKYSGPDGSHSNVFHGAIDSNEVTINVQ